MPDVPGHSGAGHLAGATSHARAVLAGAHDRGLTVDSRRRFDRVLGDNVTGRRLLAVTGERDRPNQEDRVLGLIPSISGVAFRTRSV